MKHKFKLIYIAIVILLVSITLTITLTLRKVNKEQKVLLLGNDYNIEKVDKTFTSSFMDSNYLLTILESDASKVIDNKVVKLSNLIKSSDMVLINIGKVDLEEQVIIEEDKLIYDLDIINRKKEILINNKKSIVSTINNIKKDIIIEFIQLDYPYQTNDKELVLIYKEINENNN